MNHHESFTTIPKKQKNRRGHHHVKALPIELSLLATVENLYTDRGFGFVTCQFDASRQFFHATGALTDCRDFSAMAVGDRVLCQLGPSPRTAPSPRTGQMRVLQWIHVDDLDWHSGVPPSGQSELDAFRSEFLRKRSIDYLRQRLSASWYAELVGANAKPELHDPVLLDAWLNNLAELYPDITSPTLILWGGRDSHFPPVHAHKLHAQLKSSELQIIPEATHWMAWYLAPEIAARIDSFILQDAS